MPLTAEEIIQALEANGGFVTQAAKALRCTPQNIYFRMEGSKKIKLAFEAIRAKYLDLAESQLIKKVKEGNLGAICFYLKCQGKDRGYIERQQVEHSTETPSGIRYIVEVVSAKDPDKNP